MLRRCLVLLALICAGATAHAEGTLSDGSTLVFNNLRIYEDGSSTAELPKKTPDSLWHYFNLAHCVCSFFNYGDTPADPDYHEGAYQYEITIENKMTTISKNVDFFTGTDCSNTNPEIRDANCTKVGTKSIADIQQSGVGYVDIPIYDLMVPKAGERPGCQERQLTGTTWALVDEDSNGEYEYSLSDQIETDSLPPPLPTEFKASGAENAINIEWTAPTDTTDVAYYQALCAKSDGTAALEKASNTARYVTARQLCNAAQDISLTASPISTTSETDAGNGSIVLPQSLAQLDEDFICGESATSTAKSLRIEGLENGTPYTVVLLAIDKFGNASGTYFTQSLVPQPATDFWEDIHDKGSGVEGGFCLIAQTYGDDNPLTQSLRSFRDQTLAETAYGRWLIEAYYGSVGGWSLHGSVALRILVGTLLLPVVALALLWHLLTLPGLLALAALLVAVRRLRRHRLAVPRWATAGATIACIALAPGRAHAQSPYWEDQSATSDEDSLSLNDPRRVTWHAGLRLGPYVPGIDKQIDMPIGKYAGPYEQMFGGYSVLPMLDIERFFLRDFGQLGVGVSVGYMGKKAHPWQAGSSATDPDRPRSTGDDNRFRMLPLSLNAVYRLTYLDDEYGIPLVPYARAGLAYYIWWITAPDGDFAEACKDGSSDAMCDTTSARGASLGVVGALGLAIRAERIDGSAARSMRESGIEHAGFYAEWNLGKVDGFGSDKKLSVGDSTWFAGVDFEF